MRDQSIQKGADVAFRFFKHFNFSRTSTINSDQSTDNAKLTEFEGVISRFGTYRSNGDYDICTSFSYMLKDCDKVFHLTVPYSQINRCARVALTMPGDRVKFVANLRVGRFWGADSFTNLEMPE